MKLDKVKYRSKATGNLAIKTDGIWYDSITREQLLDYQVYRQVSLFAKIV